MCHLLIEIICITLFVVLTSYDGVYYTSYSYFVLMIVWSLAESLTLAEFAVNYSSEHVTLDLDFTLSICVTHTLVAFILLSLTYKTKHDTTLSTFFCWY